MRSWWNLSAIALDPNNHPAGKDLDDRQRNAFRGGVVESKGRKPRGAGDHAQQRFAEGRTPGPHGSHIAGARPWRTIGVGVEESQHIVSPFLAAQHTRAIEPHARHRTQMMMDAPR